VSQREAIILDCTIRDGSYAIDFKFTAADTALVAGLLDAAGIRYIEVGHGLGLGASEAGKGLAASRDLEVIERTRESVQNGRIGAFFIPGIGTEALMREAASAGLDFIRIGQNADEIDQAWPFVELARELGLEPFVNFMKTYGIPPSEFAEHSRTAASLGAVGTYAVDSAGGMMPAEVAEYVRATKDLCGDDLMLGFHGHSNLHLAVANSVAAYEAGATLVDTSVYGIGRSSGNVPTEVMAAVFERLGIDCGVDALEIVDIAESYLRPLAEHLHPHDMTAVSLGYGRFHSSFLPKAERAAEQAGINPFRLIVALGRRDMMRLPDELLDEVVTDLSGRAPRPEVRPDLARFSDTRFGPRRISTRTQALGELVDGLEVVAAKRHLSIVLDLVRTESLDEETTTAEFLLEDDFGAFGRLRFGSVDAAGDALAGLTGRIDVALLDLHALAGAEADALTALLGEKVVPYRSPELELAYLGDVATACLTVGGRERVVLYDPGIYPKTDVDLLAARLAALAPVERDADAADALIVVAGPSGSVAVEDGLFLGGSEGLDRSDAYRDQLPRWKRALELARPYRPAATSA
jgi:4-hydroxy 2-oxovalerate aldolase